MPTVSPPGETAPTVLLVDDDTDLLGAMSRALRSFRVTATSEPEAAARAVQAGGFDVVVSDLMMPTMHGVDLLRRIRSIDLDVPVIFLTAAPSLETAIEAIELGAFRYLLKPVPPKVLNETVRRAAQLSRLARVRRDLLEHAGTAGRPIGDRAGLEAHFASALSGLWMAYQPIARLPEQEVWAWEALLRSHEASLPHPGALLDAAERLGRLHDLGRAIRSRIAMPPHRPGTVFVNLHPQDLLDEDLFDGDAPLSRIAGHTVLELTERAALDHVPDAAARLDRLRGLGFRIALDDLGAGYAGLSSFATLDPNVVKLDMSLVRGVDGAPVRQRLIRAMLDVCADLGMEVVAEGVETPAERDALLELGCRLFQGYLFARPGPDFPLPSFAG